MTKSNSITRDECISTHNSLMEQLNDIKKDVGNIAIEVAKLPEIMAEKFDERYASKRTEKAVDRLGWIVIVAVVGGVLSVVLK